MAKAEWKRKYFDDDAVPYEEFTLKLGGTFLVRVIQCTSPGFEGMYEAELVTVDGLDESDKFISDPILKMEVKGADEAKRRILLAVAKVFTESLGVMATLL